MAVPAGFIVGWPGASAIPTGWTRETALDDYQIKGAAASANPGTPGGAATHAHNGSASHGHSVSSHNHTGGTSGNSSGSLLASSGTPNNEAANVHNHSIATTGSTTGTLTSTTPTTATSPSDPPYITVRWIRSNGTPSGIPVGAWAWWDAAVLPSGWSSPVAARAVYLKGAAAGANGGSTGGSSSAHSHLGAPHNHAFAAHTHSGGTSGAPSATQIAGPGPPTTNTAASPTHTHTVAVLTTPSTPGSGLTASGTSGSSTMEPPFTTLGVIQNDNASPNFPVGVIGLWLGLLTAIPNSMDLCDGAGGTQDTRGKYVKGATLSGSNFTGIGTTGGATTHDHTDPTGHTHDAAHQHTITLSATSAAVIVGANAQATGIVSSHIHGGVASGSNGGTSGTGVQTVDVAANDPLHLSVLFVKFGGAIEVTINVPTSAQEFTAPSITVEWDLSSGTQVNKRVLIYAADQATLVHDSGVIVDAIETYAVPGGAGLRTGQTYYVQVEVTNNSAVPGSSNLVSFTTAWTPPATVTGLTSTPIGGT